METKPTEERGNIELTDLSFENPKLTFEQVVLREFGPDLFPPTI